MLPCKIDIRCPSFRRAAKSAAKRHRSFPKSLLETLEAIEKNCVGQGDRIAGCTLTLDIRRIKLGIPAGQRRSQEGYCLIVQFLVVSGGTVARLLDVYYNPYQCLMPPIGL